MTVFDQNCKVASHVHHDFSHNMNFESIKVIGFAANYHDRLFLETWHSTLDLNNGNDHMLLPEAYKARKQELHGHSRKLCYFK